ncbi:MAG: hypothetical protein LBG80_04390 [Bacteroidales bacterium]|jgi:hypothetical protein|nr:hypothetical protein [Bacteroidales bacterium]
MKMIQTKYYFCTLEFKIKNGRKFFYNKLEYEQLADCSRVSLSKPEYRELGRVSTNQVHQILRLNLRMPNT